MYRMIVAFMLIATTAAAQDRRASHCIALADAAPGLRYLHKASWAEPVPADSVRLSYIDHSMFLLQTEGGISIATDYNGYTGTAEFLPDVVTMNHAHSSHWTSYVDEGVDHVLKGWGPFGEGIEHHLDLGEVLIRNVPTDIRSGGGVEENGNSIFVFEVAGLCVGHLGHLHHEPNEQQYAALGRLDVVMAAVDGGLTVPIPVMTRILKRLRSSVVIPMHWFGRGPLERFLVEMSDEFDIVRTDQSSLELSLQNLPSRPTIMVLEPRYLE